MTTSPENTDGEIHITTMPTDTAAMIWHALHQTKHAKPEPSAYAEAAGKIDPLSEPEKKLYEALTDELTARANDVKEQRTKKEAP